MQTLTQAINAAKREMDRVQARLAQKQDEKRAALARDRAGGSVFDEDDEGDGDGGMVIDEEELALLREMKDLKKGYRENFDKLKDAKVAIQDA